MCIFTLCLCCFSYVYIALALFTVMSPEILTKVLGVGKTAQFYYGAFYLHAKGLKFVALTERQCYCIIPNEVTTFDDKFAKNQKYGLQVCLFCLQTEKCQTDKIII